MNKWIFRNNFEITDNDGYRQNIDCWNYFGILIWRLYELLIRNIINQTKNSNIGTMYLCLFQKSRKIISSNWINETCKRSCNIENKKKLFSKKKNKTTFEIYFILFEFFFSFFILFIIYKIYESWIIWI